MRLILTLISLLSIFSFSQTFDWGFDGYKNYSGGGQYHNIDGSGINLKITGLVNDYIYYGEKQIQTGINNGRPGTLVHIYQFIFSKKVNLKFSIGNIDMDTVNSCFIDDLEFSGNPIFSDVSGALIIGDSMVVPDAEGFITVEYNSVDTVTIIHGRGQKCYPGYVYFTPLIFKPVDQQDSNDGNSSDFIVDEESGIIHFENELFETGKSVLKTSSYKDLDKLVAYLTQHPEMKIKISGHTDNVGDPAANQKLSEARANAVATYLIEKGIDESRIITIGYGDTQPIESNDTPEGREKNRRVEFVVSEF